MQSYRYSLSKEQKPKELDWKEKFKNEFYEGDDYTSNKYENLVSFIEYEILPQQRTELLEEIKKLEYGGYIQVMASKKNWDERNGYDMAKEDITNLLNKKDE